jgi:hypothetical protein
LTVRVGPAHNQKEFLVHEELICAHSAFFKRKMSLRETNDGLVQIPTHKPDTFEYYMHWIYSHRLPVLGKDSSDGFYLIIRCNVLGDYLQDLDFRDATIDALQAHSLLVGLKPINETKFVYANTSKDAPMRRLLIDMLVYEDYSTWFAQNGKGCYTEEALSDGLSLALRLNAEKVETEAAPYKLISCHYHEHGEEPCYKDNFDLA